jgi:hypothetical protein
MACRAYHSLCNEEQHGVECVVMACVCFSFGRRFAAGLGWACLCHACTASELAQALEPAKSASVERPRASLVPHVSLLVCTPNGVVISAIDLESHSPSPHSTGRSQKLKEAALEVCRVRYLRCRPGQWPQGALMAAWALGQDIAAAPNERADDEFNDAGDQLARKLKERRAERAALWAESS